MRSPAPARLFVLLVAVTTFVGLGPGLDIATAQDTADPDIPWSYMRGIAVGDHWSYRITGNQEGEIRNEVAAMEDKTTEYFQTKFSTYRIDATGVLDSGELQPVTSTEYTLSGSKWVRTSDYATVQVEGHSTYNSAYAQQDGPQAIQAFNPPLVDNVHPFTTGYEWVWGGDVVMNPGDNSDAEGSAARYARQFAIVEGQENIRVPAGTFDAWRLNYTSVVSSGAYTIRWHSDTACDLVKEESYDKSHQLKHRLELLDYSCTGAQVDQPKYDTTAVTLLSRGLAGGSTGATPPTPNGDGEGPKGDAPGLGLVGTIAVIGLAGALLRRQRR